MKLLINLPLENLKSPKSKEFMLLLMVTYLNSQITLKLNKRKNTIKKRQPQLRKLKKLLVKDLLLQKLQLKDKQPKKQLLKLLLIKKLMNYMFKKLKSYKRNSKMLTLVNNSKQKLQELKKKEQNLRHNSKKLNQKPEKVKKHKRK